MDPARLAIERHADAVNDRQIKGYLATMAYPFTYQNYNGVAFTVQSAQDFDGNADFPWDVILRTDPDWSHTAFDSVEEVARSSSSAVFKVVFRRIDQSDRASEPYEAIWIATCQDGQWGVQFRHNLGCRESAGQA